MFLGRLTNTVWGSNGGWRGSELEPRLRKRSESKVLLRENCEEEKGKQYTIDAYHTARKLCMVAFARFEGYRWHCDEEDEEDTPSQGLIFSYFSCISCNVYRLHIDVYGKSTFL